MPPNTQLPDLTAVLLEVADNPLVGTKPDQLLQFKRPQLAVSLQSIMEEASTPAAKQANNSQLVQVIAALSQLPSLKDHVVGYSQVHPGQKSAELHLSFKDTAAQHRQQLASAGSLRVRLLGAQQLTTMPVRTVQCKQLPDITVVRMHNIPAAINVQGLMACLLGHCNCGPEYYVVAEYGGDLLGEVAAMASTWCRTDVSIAEVRAPACDAKLSQLPTALSCLGQQVSVSVQNSILGKAYVSQGYAGVAAAFGPLRWSLLS